MHNNNQSNDNHTSKTSFELLIDKRKESSDAFKEGALAWKEHADCSLRTAKKLDTLSAKVSSEKDFLFWQKKADQSRDEANKSYREWHYIMKEKSEAQKRYDSNICHEINRNNPFLRAQMLGTTPSTLMPMFPRSSSESSEVMNSPLPPQPLGTPSSMGLWNAEPGPGSGLWARRRMSRGE